MDLSLLHKDGDQVNGRYKIVRAIGKGAMGEVYVAEDSAKSNKEIAIKYLKWQPGKSGALDQFKAEFATLTHLSHPHIAHVYDLEQDTTNGQFFFTSELVSGKEFLQIALDISVSEIEELFVQSLRALEYLHGNGIVHFDIKSANILVSNCAESGGKLCVKLIDFGLASLRFQGRLAGTPSYMAPEMVRKENPDGRADLYSLGVLIYTALAGNNPFRTQKMEDTLQNQLKLYPPPPSKHNDDVPSHLDSVVMRLLEKRPQDRYQTAAQVITDLSMKAPKRYTVETEETQGSYIPWESKFIGRADDLLLVNSLLQSKKNAAIILSGSSGSGKSRFLNEAKYLAQMAEWITLVFSDPLKMEEFEKNLAESKNLPLFVAIDDYDLVSEELWGVKLEKIIKDLIAKIIRPAGEGSPLILMVSTTGAVPSAMSDDENKEWLQKIDLSNFTLDEIKDYLSALTGLSNPPKQIVEQIHTNTTGNPYIVTEVVKEMVNEGLLIDTQGRWKETTFEDIKIDFERLNISSSLEERLLKDFVALPEEAKHIMQLIAATARPVTVHEIESISGLKNTKGLLLSLMRRGHLKNSAENGSYYFTRPICQHAIYAHIEESDLAKLHDLISKYLQKSNGDEEEVLYHTGRGSSPDKAKESLENLIELQIRHHKNFEAIGNLSYYLKKWNKPKMQLMLARLYYRMGKLDDAIKTAENLPTDASDEEKVFSFEIMGTAFISRKEYTTAREKFSEALKIANNLSAAKRIRIENFLAEVTYFEGKVDEAIKTYERTSKEALKLPREDQKTILNNNLGQCYFQKGEYQKAVIQLEADLASYQGIEDERLIARTRHDLAESYRLLKNYEKADEHFKGLVEYAREKDDLEHLFRTYNGLGNLYNDQGKAEQASEYYERAIDIALRLGREEEATVCIANLGIINADLGKVKRAEEYFLSALAFLEGGRKKSGIMERYHCRIHLELGEVYRLGKKFDEATKHLDEAFALSNTPATEDLRFWIVLTAAKVDIDQGKKKDAKSLLKEAGKLATNEIQKIKLRELIKSEEM